VTQRENRVFFCQPDGVANIGLVIEVPNNNAMNEKESSVGNCPYCNKVVLNAGDFKDEASFCMRCPHCQKDVYVEIKKETVVIVSKKN